MIHGSYAYGCNPAETLDVDPGFQVCPACDGRGRGCLTCCGAGVIEKEEVE